ncbi:hypothetical protein HYT33_03615 [Candidatus Roizmanbacteria bacterium]|nr:hypothetical protein [Candidatus Roizmanbacteria bacterium]
MLPFLKKALSIGKKLFIVIVVYFAVVSLFVYFTSENIPKQNIDPIKHNRAEIYKTIKNPELNSSKEGKFLIAIYRAALCGFIGEGCTSDPNDGNKNFDRSLFGFATNLIVLPYTNPPASGVYWAYSGLENAGFLPKTYAAEGVGFAALKPIQGLWKIFRDLAFILLVLVLITIGFLIMFRVKINPQTIVSLENSLPRIVAALLLITFSFAIAGFLIDLMYVVIVVSVSAMARANIGELKLSNLQKLQNQWIGAGLIELWPFGVGGFGPFQVGIALVNILPSFIRGVFKGLIAFVATRLLQVTITSHLSNFIDATKGLGGTIGVIGTVLGFGGGGTVGINFGNITGIPAFLIELFIFLLLFPYMAGVIVGLMFVLTLVFFIFRVFFLLFGAYIKILLLVILSPVILLMGVFPGRNAVSFWFKNLLAELITFPLVIIIMLIGYAITRAPLIEGRLFRPPFLYQIDPNTFAVLVGMGIVLLIPNLVRAVKEYIGLKGPGLGFTAGLFFAGATGATGGAMETLQKYYYSSMAVRTIRESLTAWREKRKKTT